MPVHKGTKVVAVNRKARHDYFIEDMLNKTDIEKDSLIKLTKNLNREGMEKLILYAKDLLKIYQYCKNDQIYESE